MSSVKANRMSRQRRTVAEPDALLTAIADKAFKGEIGL